MTIKFHFDPNKKIIYGSATGSLDLGEFQRIMHGVTNSKDFPPDTNTLWDLRLMNFQEIERGFEQLVIHIRKQFPERGNARVAYITSSDLGFGLTRMYEMLSDDLPQQIRVFKDFGEGEKWLLTGIGKGDEIIADE